MYEWISVKDRLPEDNEVVLTYRPKSQGISNMVVESYISGMWGGDAPYRGAVEYWMPLPEAPKEG